MLQHLDRWQFAVWKSRLTSNLSRQNINSFLWWLTITVAVTILGAASYEYRIGDQIEFINQGQEDLEDIVTKPVLGQVVVDIEGAVERPGIYQLAAGTRWGEAIDQAGGMKLGADENYVARQINLAAEVFDEDKLYLPYVGEGNGSDDTKAENSQKLISINTASESELQQIDGIGEKRAAEIVSNRPYTAIDELVAKQIISQTLFSEIKSQIQL